MSETLRKSHPFKRHRVQLNLGKADNCVEKKTSSRCVNKA